MGSFQLTAATDAKPEVVGHTWKKLPDGFETTGTLLLNGGRLRQTLTVTSIGKQTVVYQDRVVAVTNVTVQAELGVPVGIENDQISGGHRVVSSQSGQAVFDDQAPQQPVALVGSWANVDGRLGVVSVLGSGITYAQASRYAPGISVREDILYASRTEHSRSFQAGDEVAHRVAIFYTEVTPKETASLADASRVEEKSGAQFLRVKEPGGKSLELPLR